MELFFLRVRTQRMGIPGPITAEGDPTLKEQALADSAAPMAVRAEVQHVSISPQQALDLVPALLDAGRAQEAFDRLQQMLAKNEAVLLDWPVNWMRLANQAPGETCRAVSESADEVRYDGGPQIFNPPQGFTDTDLQQMKLAKLRFPSWGLFIPETYGTRNLGAPLETEAMIEEGGRVKLECLQQSVRLLRFDEIRIQRSPHGIEGIRSNPQIKEMKSEAHVSLAAERPILIGNFFVREPEPHVELAILRATTKHLPREAIIPAPISVPEP
jgi:hypothetical protein